MSTIPTTHVTNTLWLGLAPRRMPASREAFKEAKRWIDQRRRRLVDVYQSSGMMQPLCGTVITCKRAQALGSSHRYSLRAACLAPRAAAARVCMVLGPHLSAFGVQAATRVRHGPDAAAHHLEARSCTAVGTLRAPQSLADERVGPRPLPPSSAAPASTLR